MSDSSNILLNALRTQLLADYKKCISKENISACLLQWLSLRLAPARIDASDSFPASAIIATSKSAEGADYNFKEIAVLGYLSQIEQLTPELITKLSEGLDWISSRAAYQGSLPPTFEVSGKAILGYAIGAISLNSDVRDKIKIWVESFADKSLTNDRIDALERTLILLALMLLKSSKDVASIRQKLPADVNLLLDAVEGKQVSEEIQSSAIRLLLTKTPDPHDTFSNAVGYVLLLWCGIGTPLVHFRERSVEAVLNLLESSRRSFKRWPWNNAGTNVEWEMPDEYHVQSFLWSLLAPVFPDLEDEEYLISLGFKHPRVDLCIPSLRLIIEVKYMRTGTTSELAGVTEQIAADSALYLRNGSNFDSLIAFIWDNSRRTEQHSELIQGLLHIRGVSGAVVIPRPGKMEVNQPSTQKKKTKKNVGKKAITSKKKRNSRA